MIGDIRADLSAPELPFVVGQLGEFFCHRTDPTKNPFAKNVNAALASIPHKVSHTACVKSEGLKDSGDEVHFNAAAQREMGRRFATEMQKLQSGKK